MTTCKGQHELVVILADGPEQEQTVVRWCNTCGAITVDIDADGETAPGAIMALQLPDTEMAKRGYR